MNHAPQVSVVIPTYRRREFVQRAVASVRAQTVQDYEIIVIDDGSTDGTREALEGQADIRYVWQENRGVSAARNTGIGLARAGIVAFLDSDDLWWPAHLAIVTEALRHRPEAILCSTSPRFEIGGRQRPVAADVVDALPALYAENIVGNPSGVAARRDAIDAVGGFDERLRVMEPWDLWLRLAARGPFAFLRQHTIVYQATRGSLTERGSRSEEYRRAMAIVAEHAAAIAVASRRVDAPDLRRRAVGMSAYFAALQAVAEGDEPGARAALVEACARLPELSREPQLVANRAALMRFGAESRLRSYATAATTWPDLGVDTPLYLRVHALVLALRLGRWSVAWPLLRSWPIAATPRFLVRNLPLFARLARRTLQKARYRGADDLPSPERPSVP